jgi:hypothetical protein
MVAAAGVPVIHLSRTEETMRHLPVGPTARVIVPFVVLALAACHAATHLFERKPVGERGVWLWPVAAGLLALCFGVGAGGRAFIYFQF